jgi:hypothetical protein
LFVVEVSPPLKRQGIQPYSALFEKLRNIVNGSGFMALSINPEPLTMNGGGDSSHLF